MIIRQELQAYVLANPGKKLREITTGIGITDRDGITHAGAQLYQLVRGGFLRNEVVPGQLRGFRYFPTATTLTSVRQTVTPEQLAENARTRELRKRDSKRAKRRLSAAQQQAFYANAPVAPTSVRAPIAPAPPKAARPAAKVETVEEFLKRGGRVQRLASHDTSHPLRYDHSHGAALNRPHRRARVAVSP